ncbi:hypothetical protein SO802_001056 [Lithocarpus litseifolius]|uniref:Uncharacterized protein n=1 Tax=Lithocarpus litseifolius TaxID=425828 RepID=A0AAW2DTB0_9ROSI
MKFGKEFASQMVQEWQEAYMDYNYLKTILKDILQFKKRNPSTPKASTSQGSLKRRVSLCRAFSGLTSRHRSSPKKNEDEVILVNAVVQQQEEESERHYQTMFLMSSEMGGEYELVFFRRLDDEFNRVVNFYKKKVEAVMAEANELTKQMDVFIALRIKVYDPVMEFNGSDPRNISSNGASSPSATAAHSINARKPGLSHMDAIQEVEMSSEGHLEDEKQEDHIEKACEHSKSKGNKVEIKGFRPASLDILNHVKINVTPETPVSTLKGILMSSNSDFSFIRKELRKAEQRMTQAFIEFYQKLRLLKSYCCLNQLAFSKIMKKYDKITSRNASKTYMEMVDNSYIASSDEVHNCSGNSSCVTRKDSIMKLCLLIHLVPPLVTRLMERVEVTFIKHFANGHHRKGMDTLRPKARRERHRITFSLGFALLALVGIISNLDMEMDPRTKSFRALTELVPLGLLTVVLLIILCPFNIIFRSSRFFLIQSTLHCLCAPLYKVSTLPDFFLADQLTSQCKPSEVCYYGWGDFKRRSNMCKESGVFQTFYFIVVIIPYSIRFLQSLQRFVEEKDAMQGLNGLKLFLILIAVAMRTSYDLKRVMTWRIIAAVNSSVAIVAATYWDIVIDWGLLQRNSKNPWLRDKLLVSNRSVYFVAMASVLNVVLRLAWMQSVLGFIETPFLHRQALIAIVTCLEILRRGIWNFFRLENEHLNNVGEYRAFKSVPLPFYYDDDEDKDI